MNINDQSQHNELKRMSAINRAEISKKFKEKNFDLIIIGGGITGAGIALDAVTRGMSVALVEKNDFASGTSSRSTKLVHGGLRYLEQLELALVAEVGREREIVYRNAQHIVIPEKMLLPIIKGGTLGNFTTSIGLLMYDFLAGVKKSESRQMLSKEEVLEKEPLLNNEMLEAGALYYEYKTDDSRLTIEAMKKAVEKGALVLNYTEVTEFVLNDNGKVCGVTVTDNLNNEKYNIQGTYVVNATGAWVDLLRKKDNSLKGKRLHLTKGIHIVIPRSRFNLSHAIYFDVGDSRMVFAIPRFNVVYVGTTDTTYDGNLDEPEIEQKDVEYLLKALQRISPDTKLTMHDVESAWAGLRPLIHQEGKSPSELSRKDEIFESESGLMSIAGGKLTGYRLMAKKVVDLVAKKLKKNENRETGKCITKPIKLAGAEFDFQANELKLREYCELLYERSMQTGIDYADFRILFHRYGTNMEHIAELAYDHYNQTKKSAESWLLAETEYLLEHEMACTLSDVFIRRTGKIHFFIKNIQNELPLVANFMAEKLKWADAEKEAQVKNMNQLIYKASHWK